MENKSKQEKSKNSEGKGECIQQKTAGANESQSG